MSMLDYAWITLKDAEALEKFKASGMQIAVLPKDVQAGIYEAVQKVQKDNCAADPFYKKVYDSQQEFLGKFRSAEYQVQPEYKFAYPWG